MDNREQARRLRGEGLTHAQIAETLSLSEASVYQSLGRTCRAVRKLSARELATLDYIREFIDTRGYSPSVRDIGAAIGIPSTSLINRYVTNLENAGKIKRDGRVARSIRLVEAEA